MIQQCASCGRMRPHYGRRLCKPCHDRASRIGTLSDWPTSERTRAGLLEDVAWLVAQGAGWREACMRLGYRTGSSPTKTGLYRALSRAGRLDLWQRLREAA